VLSRIDLVVLVAVSLLVLALLIQRGRQLARSPRPAADRLLNELLWTLLPLAVLGLLWWSR